MKSFVLVTVLVAALAASVAATIDLYFDHTELHPGTTYKLEWDTDHDYILTLLLVKGFPRRGGWQMAIDIFDDMVQQTGHGSWNWSVPFDIEAYDKYGLWLRGTNYPSDGWGYANLTQWFSISEPDWRFPHSSPVQIACGAVAVMFGGLLITVLTVLGVSRAICRAITSSSK